eukprot:gene17841-20638_t
MCRKFALIYNIENTTIQELCAYLRRLHRIYLIFTIISGINLFTDSIQGKRVAAILAGVNILLYLMNIVILQRASNDPTVMNANLAVFGLLLISAFNIFTLIYNVLTGNIWALFSVVGVILQWSTVYIVYKLREKVVNGENTQNPPVMNPAVASAPVQAYAEPVTSPVYVKADLV